MYYNYYMWNYCKRIATTDVAIVGDELVLTIPSMALCNRKFICIKICQDIPAEITADMPVVIKNGCGESYPLIGCYANNVYADQVRKYGSYGLSFAVDTELFIYKCGWRLCRTAHVFDCIPIPTPVEVESLKIKSIKGAKK